MKRQINKLYLLARGRELPDLPLRVLLALCLSYSGTALRGLIRSLLYRRVSQPHFIGKRVVIRNSNYLRSGAFVVLGAGSVIDAFGEVGISMGDRVTVGINSNLLASTVIREPGIGISIGDNTSIGIRNTIWGQGGVKIGANCLLGPDVVVVSENHTFASRSRPILDQANVREAVQIADDCWLGAGVKVMPGVSIGRGSIIGAGAVVTRSLPPYSIAAGVPARVIGTRP